MIDTKQVRKLADKMEVNRTQFVGFHVAGMLHASEIELRDCADEIERLRAELDALSEQVVALGDTLDYLHGLTPEKATAQKNEVSTLRELVREAHDHIENNCYWTDWLERAEKVLVKKEGPEGP